MHFMPQVGDLVDWDPRWLDMKGWQLKGFPGPFIVTDIDAIGDTYVRIKIADRERPFIMTDVFPVHNYKRPWLWSIDWFVPLGEFRTAVWKAKHAKVTV